MGDSPDTEQNMDFCSPGSSPSHEEGATALDTTTQFAVLDNVVGDPKDSPGFTVAQSRGAKREEMLAVRQTEHQNKVNTSGFTLAEQENEEETVVIVKPKGDKGLELVSSSKTRKGALDNSPFYVEGIVKVTPNHVKNLFVVSVSKTANQDRICNVNKLGGIPFKCYLPFSKKVESCVTLNAEQSISEGNSKKY